MTSVSLEQSGGETFSDIGLGMNGAGKHSVSAAVIGRNVVARTNIGEPHPLISKPHRKHMAIKKPSLPRRGEGFRFSVGSAYR